VHGAPACVTVKVWPAIVSVPVRCAFVVFAATLYGTLPLPVPLVAPVRLIQPAFVAADHVQFVPALTVTLPVVPLDDGEMLAGEMPGAQGAWKRKPLDVVLGVVPPGPTALTRASRLTPVGGAECNNVGLPRSTVSIGVVPPEV
jgi:hypothetical protein